MEEKRLRERLLLASPGVATPMQARLTAARLKLDAALAALHDRHVAWGRRQAEGRAKGTAAWREARADWQASLVAHRAELKAAWVEWKAARLEVRSALVYACCGRAASLPWSRQSGARQSRSWDTDLA